MKSAVGLVLFFSLTLPLMAAEWPVTIDWQHKVTLSTPLTGRVAVVEVEPGDLVKQGQLLAALDARLYEAEVKSARSILQRTRVTFEESQRAYDRAKELYDRTVLSTTDFQQAELDHAIATANYHNSQALLSKARINLEYTQLKAPFDGVILKRMISPGETVSSQYQVQPMVEMAASGQMIARGWLPQNALRNLTVGQSIELNLRNKRLPATIKSAGIQYRESQKDTEYLVEFSFQPPVDHKLLPGMRAQAILP